MKLDPRDLALIDALLESSPGTSSAGIDPHISDQRDELVKSLLTRLPPKEIERLNLLMDQDYWDKRKGLVELKRILTAQR